MATRVGDGVTVFSTASKSSYTTGTDGGSNYTVGSGSDRALLIWVQGYTDLGGGAKGASAVTHNGQSALKYDTLPSFGRNYIELWYIPNPTTGSGGTTVDTNSLNRAMRVEVVETIDTDQTTPINAANDNFGGGGVNSVTFNLTTTAANSLLMAAVSVQAGAGTFSVSDGGTLTSSGGGQTGAGGTTDVSGAVAYEAVPTASAESLTISWANANNTAGLMVEVMHAAGGTPASATPGAGSVSVDGAAPTAAAGADAAPGAGAVTLQGYAPTVAAAVSANPGPGATSAQGLAPVASAAATASADAGAVTVQGYAPTVDIGGASVNAQPGNGSITVVGFAPAVSAGVTITCGLGTITIQGAVPAASAAANSQPGAGSVAAQGQAPVASASVSASPGAGGVAVQGRNPSASAGVTVVSGAGIVTVQGYAPMVAVGNVASRRAALTADSASGVILLSAANDIANIPLARGVQIIQG